MSLILLSLYLHHMLDIIKGLVFPFIPQHHKKFL